MNAGGRRGGGAVPFLSLGHAGWWMYAILMEASPNEFYLREHICHHHLILLLEKWVPVHSGRRILWFGSNLGSGLWTTQEKFLSIMLPGIWERREILWPWRCSWYPGRKPAARVVKVAPAKFPGKWLLSPVPSGLPGRAARSATRRWFWGSFFLPTHFQIYLVEEQRCAPLPHFGQFVLTWVKPGVFIPILEGDSMGVTPRGNSFKVGGILPPDRN